MKYCRLFCYFVVLLSLLCAKVSAQYSWNTLLPESDGRYEYCIDALDCSGDNCTAVGTLVDDEEHTITRLFWRSIDGGKTWAIQNPSLFVDTTFIVHHIDLRRGYFTAVQQIDSLNAVAGGFGYNINSARDTSQLDSCLILRTFDAGKTWQRQSIDNRIPGLIKAIHFADPLNGIALRVLDDTDVYSNKVGSGPTKIYTTTDGGNHWESIAYNFSGALTQCYCYGKEQYGIFASHGPIYLTKDNWSHIDTLPLFNDIIDPQDIYRFTSCNFSGGDTIFVYGFLKARSQCLLMRSVDHGKHWETPFISDSLSSIQRVSSFNGDTILAAGESANKILMSTDRGFSWRVDSLFLDKPYNTASVRSIVFNASGIPLAVFGEYSTPENIVTVLIKGSSNPRSVEWTAALYYYQRIYPNPSSTELRIASIEAPTPFHIKDLLGRTVISGMVGDHTDITVDVSHLPKGIYFVFVDDLRDGHTVLVGKAMVGQ